MQQPTISQNICLAYKTDNYNVSFTVEFGKGKESSSYLRTQYDHPYDIEIYDDNDIKSYRLLAEEGPIVMKVYNVKVTNTKRKISNGYIQYNYGITAVLDINNEPLYNNPTSFTPSNDIERDGKPWIILNDKTLQVDQNGSALFQWSVAKALDKGVKPTAEQELMGIEERHENSGMIYITFQPIYIETEIVEKQEVTRGLTRGFAPAPSIKSHAARVGYGSRAETKSVSTVAIAIPNSRLVLPIRTRIIGDTFNTNIKCAKDLQSALRVEELQKKIGVIGDE